LGSQVENIPAVKGKDKLDYKISIMELENGGKRNRAGTQDIGVLSCLRASSRGAGRTGSGPT